MVEMILLEIISIISFIYSILLIMMPFASMKNVLIVFIWTIVAAIIFSMNYKKGLIQKLSVILLLMPLLVYNDPLSIYFIIISTILIVAYIVTSFLQGNHVEYADTLKNSYRIYIFMIIVAIIYDGFSGVLAYGIPFIIIYLLTSTILLRTMRHLDSGMSLKDISSVNRRYIGIISIVSFIVTIESFRNIIFAAFNIVYTALISITFKILYYPVYFILSILDKLWLLGFSRLNPDGVEHAVEGYEPGEIDVQGVIKEFPALEFIFRIGLTLLLIYILYRLIRKVSNRNYESAEYTEERQFIKKDKKEKASKKKKRKEKYPQDRKDQIRYFYRRYLENLQEEKVELLNSDTSLDVNEKASGVFERSKNDEIRSIYIKNRYSNKDTRDEELEKIKKLSHEE